MPLARIRPAPAYAYIARCADGTYYTGATNDVPARIAEHNAGRGAKYVRGRTPVAVVYVRACSSYPQALKAECALKRLTRAEKIALIRRRGAARA